MDRLSGQEEKRFFELARKAAYAGCAFSKFLEPGQETAARAAAAKAGTAVLLFGGYDQAERRMAGFFAGEPEEAMFPIADIRLRWAQKYGDIGHRDILGALMGLGIQRETTGDILLAQGEAHVLCLPEMASYIAANLDSVGRMHVSCELSPLDCLVVPEPVGREVRDTVASVRLDAVLAAAYHLSRGEVQKFIAGGLVKKNHTEELRAEAKLDPGDILSVRGYGRVKLLEIIGETKKGRVAIRYFLYGK